MDLCVDRDLLDPSPGATLDRLARAAKRALDELQATTDAVRLDRAAELLARAEVIHVLGQRSAFAVAAYLAHVLGQLDVRARLLTGIGGTTLQQASVITPRDTLLAIGFAPYCEETLAAMRRADGRDVPVVALTDSPSGALADTARVSIEVKEAAVDLAALSATMCLALALAVRLGHRLDRLGLPRSEPIRIALDRR